MRLRRKFPTSRRIILQKLIPINYTTKTLYGKFIYVIKAELSFPTASNNNTTVQRNITTKPIQTWLEKKCQGRYKTHATWNSTTIIINDRNVHKNICTYRIYLENKSDYENFKKVHKSIIVSCTQPATQEHEDLIKNGLIIDVRSHLYYSKYRYKIYFKMWWNSENKKYIVSSVKNFLYDEAKKTQDYMFSRYGGSLYLKHHSDLLMLQISLTEFISSINVISTYDEIDQLHPVS